MGGVYQSEVDEGVEGECVWRAGQSSRPKVGDERNAVEGLGQRVDVVRSGSWKERQNEVYVRRGGGGGILM